MTAERATRKGARGGGVKLTGFTGDGRAVDVVFDRKGKPCMVRMEKDGMAYVTSRSHGSDRVEDMVVERCIMLRARILDAVSDDDEFLEEYILIATMQVTSQC